MKTLFNFFFLFSFALHAGEDLEVRLSTKANLKPLYLSQVYLPSDLADWRYAEELRSILAFDFAHNGYTGIAPSREEREKELCTADPKLRFDLNFWKKEKISFAIALAATSNTLSITVFQIEKGTSKRYPEIALTGQIEQDRTSLHQVADTIQKDLFGTQGIASLHLLYSQRLQGGSQNEPEWLSHVWISDADGANARPLSHASGYCMSPGFLPNDKAGYYYVSQDSGQWKIYRSTVTDTKPSLWLRLRGNQMLPAISRCGKQIAFITDLAGRPDLFLQKLDSAGTPVGPPRQLFSASNATQASPTFSPDGKKIAFVSDKDGSARVYILDIADPRDVKKPKPKLLTRKNRENTSPSWSPDGKKIAYSARTEGVRQIWIYDLEQEEEWQLTHGPDNKENPSWAPNSIHLVYNTETNDLSELFIVDLFTQEPFQISSGFGQKRFPYWEMRLHNTELKF